MSDRGRLARTGPYNNEHWLGFTFGGQTYRDTGSTNTTLPASPQVKHRQDGMDVEALKRAHKRFANYARFRIDSIGREYDDGEQQRFESMSPQRLILEMRDELADAVNYLAFLDIQLSRWAQRLEEIE